MTISQLIKIGIGTVVGIFLLCVLLGASASVPQGSVGILLRFGKANTEIMTPGLHMKVPFSDTIENIPVSTFRYDTGNLGLKSKDSQEIVSNITVTLHTKSDNCAVDLYTQTGGDSDKIADLIVKPTVIGITGSQFSSYTIEELVTKRADLKNGLFKSVRDKLGAQCLAVEDVNITTFGFSDQYNQSIEGKVIAEQSRLTAQLTLDKEKISSEIRVVNAKADAEAEIAKADGDSKAVKLRADAEADAIRVKASALNAAPASYVNYIAAQQWNGQLPQVTNGTPLLSLPVHQ